ncbi:MAG: hypothetical protein NZ959_07080 [Armatimonadetes bacterium]|nr:hypothetical protein [Armatimonadota bacterium]MDW8120936.1 hypothetical protein [Armatimonadota bacterium]
MKKSLCFFAVRQMLLVVALTLLVIGLGTIQGCGGGAALIGGGVITGGRSLAGGLVGDLSRALNVSHPGLRGRGTKSGSLLLPRQPYACPVVTSNWDPDSDQPAPDPWTITVDYGSNCPDPDLGVNVSGSITLSISNYEVDPETGDLTTGTITLTYNNLTIGTESVSGSWSYTVVNPTTWQCLIDLTFTSGSVTQRLTFGTSATPGTITISETQMMLSGSGTYRDSRHPQFGTVGFVFNNLTYDINGACPYPVGGSISITGGGHRIVASFSRTLPCGHANLTINGVSQGVVDLTQE